MTSKKSIGVITAIFGNYDKVPPVPKGFDTAILVSNLPIHSEWQNKLLKTKFSPSLSAKIPKFRPDLFLDTDSSVWVDANFRETDLWLSDVSRNLLAECDLALFQHPSRNSVSEEIFVSMSKFKYAGIDFSSQILYYISKGFTDTNGLWAGGVIARNHISQNESLGNEWLLQNIIWNTQDQISLPWVLYKLNLTPIAYPRNLYNENIYFIGHGTNWTTRKGDIIKLFKLIWTGNLKPVRKFILSIFKSRFSLFSYPKQ